MGKIIRLTESDLVKLVKRVINETILDESLSLGTIKGVIKSKWKQDWGKSLGFVEIKLGTTMRHGYYYDSVITQSNVSDSRIKPGTKGTVGKIDKNSKKCKFVFNNPSSGEIELEDIVFKN